MNIEKYIVEVSANGVPNSIKFVNFLDFVNDLKELLIAPRWEHNIEKNKKYYSNGITIPKDRINNLKKRYNLHKVIDVTKADYIFSDGACSLADKIPRGMYCEISFVSESGVSTFSYHDSFDTIIKDYKSDKLLESRINNFKKYSLKPGDDYKEHTIVLRLDFAKKVYEHYSKFLIDKPFVDVSILVEEEFPLLYHTDFITDFYTRLSSDNSRYMSLLGLYSNYNLQSVKILLRKYLNKGDKNIMRLVDNLQNKDVYTKYILKNIEDIRTNREDLKNLYYFSRVVNKFKNKYDNKLRVSSSKYIENEIIKIKAKYIIENEK